MLGQALITFREVLEAALIVAITLAYLSRTGRAGMTRHLWTGVWLAVGASLAAGVVVGLIYGQLDEEALTLFEGVSALVAVVLLTSMILWMALKGPSMQEEVRTQVERATLKGAAVGLVAFAFVVVFREGLETVLFLTPFAGGEPAGTVVGAIVGVSASLVISYMMFKVGVRVDLKKFFYVTSVLLVLVAAGLAGYGVHELIEHQEEVGASVGWFGSIAYDLGIPDNSLMGNHGVIGSILAVMFGYSVKMEWGRVLVQLTYTSIFLPLTVLLYKRPELFARLTRLTARRGETSG